MFLKSIFRVICAGLLWVVTACDKLPENPPETVASVDLERYQGLWYEIVRLPVPFQKSDEMATAEYRLRQDGTVHLVNTAVKPDGSTRSVTGVAVPVEGTNNTRLKVTIDNFFAKLFGSPPEFGNYWVLKLDEDYQYALVGSPDRDTLWLLSREPKIAPAVLESYVDYAETQGYAVAELIHNNGNFPTGFIESNE